MRYFLFLLPWFWIHEAGHFLAALFCGHWLTFVYSPGNLWGIPIPRYCWDMPKGLSGEQMVIIWRAGFVAEFFAGVLLTALLPWIGAVYLLGAVLHRLVYVHYGGNPREIGR